MSRILAVLSLVLALGLWPSVFLVAQSQGAAHAAVVIPDSSIEHAADLGVRAHTNHVVIDGRQNRKGNGAPAGETPASLSCVYAVVSNLTSGCPIATSKATPSGGFGTIAIVDAYDYPTAYNDLSVFSNQFNLPKLPQCTRGTTTSCFQKVYATGTIPATNCGWNQEAALDIEWAHAMAPNAKIVLVEAASNSFTDLFAAIDLASSIVSPTGSAGTGLGQVSMSWGGGEFSGESSFDSHLTTAGVVYFASSGDSGGNTIYPGASPNVVSAGGTTVNRIGGNFLSETAWSGSGGGMSSFEAIPAYQSGIAGIAGTQRGVPDVSFDADPNSGVAVYDSTTCQGQAGWQVFGGTSVAAPSWAGMVNLAGGKHNSTDTELSTIYSCSATPTCYNSNFRDITSGSAGGFNATQGWDFITGVGSPLGLNNK
ncbi:MAG TPA: S53 family peptidase [Terriglobia bacterium]|nr:S53 family peptidase [Terriglobia bacterium]